MSVLDRIKDRVKDIVSEVDTEKINRLAEDYNQKQDQLMRDLEKAKADYIERTTAGDKFSVNFKRLNNNDITNLAKAIIDEDYDNKKSEINKQYNQKVKQAEKGFEDIKKKAAETIKQSEEELKQKTDKIHSKGMKNNISRSSAVELTKQQAIDENDAVNQQLTGEIVKAEQDKNSKIAQAEADKQITDEKADKEYNANLTAKVNELKDLKDSTSEYENEYIDQREATNYSNELVSLVTEFALSLPVEAREIFFNQNKQINNLLTEDEINYIKQMVLS